MRAMTIMDSAQSKEVKLQKINENKVYKLVDILNSNLDLNADDIDYKLNHQQIIKVMKIFLHMLNVTHQKHILTEKELTHHFGQTKKHQEVNLKL